MIAQMPPGLKNLLIIMVLVSFAQVALPKTGYFYKKFLTVESVIFGH